MRTILTMTLFAFALVKAQAQTILTSPDKKITVQIDIADSGKIRYAILFGHSQVIRPSALGLIRSDGDYSKGFKLQKADPVQKVTDTYTMVYAKKRTSTYAANKKVCHFKNAQGLLDIIFQVSDDGVAFRYYFPGKSDNTLQLTDELTTFHFPVEAKGFLQPMQVAKSGYLNSNPAYEEDYVQDIPVGTPSTLGQGWVYPALFKVKDTWVLITEAALENTDCATRLRHNSPDGEYQIGYPDPREVFTGGQSLPQIHLPYTSPWRIITIGSLATIIESTLGTDLAKPSLIADASFVKPGKAAWSWIDSKSDSIVYSAQKRYIDFAADMNWQYSLIDSRWDKQIGPEKTKDLCTYAATKNIGVLVWYNSGGNWNGVKSTPKDKLLSHESRVTEFKMLNDLGVKGIKIDFFGGDGQSMIDYYIGILKDAATFKLMVDFHGTTLPRGWARTYPNLVTAEAVRGFENITVRQSDADLEANLSAVLPFTRNAFDPMDFTPMNLYKINSRIKRKTTSAFELATSVLFLSGIQHFAESPAGMTHVPDQVKDFLRKLPVSWDDVKFIDGYPGKYVVLARKSGHKWYVAGINGENTEKKIEIDPSIFGAKTATLITEGDMPLSFKETKPAINQKITVSLHPSGGFVMVCER